MLPVSLVSYCQSRSCVCTGGDIQLQQLQGLWSYLVLVLAHWSPHWLHITWTEYRNGNSAFWVLYFWGGLSSFLSSYPQNKQSNSHWNMGTWDLRFCLTFVFFRRSCISLKNTKKITVVPFHLIIWTSHNVIKRCSPKT